jgi:hypothetical protein
VLNTRHNKPQITLDDENTSTKPLEESERNQESSSHVQLESFRIFPDWQSSFFWRAPVPNRLPHRPYNVEQDEIESLFPSLASFFSEWRNVYETALEDRKCHLRSGVTIFPDISMHVASKLEGFLMACWLVLQPNVETVEYWPSEKKYKVDKNTMEKELLTFLTSSAALLSSM